MNLGCFSEDSLRRYLSRTREVAPESLSDIDPLLSLEQARVDQIRVTVAEALSRGALRPPLVPEPGMATASAPIEVWQSGLRSSLLGKLLVLLLPEIRSLTHCWQLLDDINRLYSAPDAPIEWLIDCSSIREAETLLLSTLLGYERELRQRGGRARLCWLRDTTLADPLRVRFETLFGLVRRAGHYFSR